MVKRIVVAGNRYYNNYKEAKEYIDYCITNIREKYRLIFISGCCYGADALGERYAKENDYDYDIEYYPAKWNEFGKKAGPMRNKEMAIIADYVICFWDGKSTGTKSMINFAKKFNKPLRVKFILINKKR